MRRWQIAAVIALVVIVVSIPIYALRQSQQAETGTTVTETHATFVGREQCIDCHTAAYESWLGSDHDNAMDIASEETVSGDFNNVEFEHRGVVSRFYRKDEKYFVNTEGSGGEMADFEVTHTFGVEPLQQYMVPFPGGRLQVLSVVWDVERAQWISLNPDTDIAADDWLHWTRNGQNWNGMCAECHSTNLRKNFDPETNP